MTFPSLLSDEHNEGRDTTLAKHVMNVHVNAPSQSNKESTQGELPLPMLQKFIR